MKKTFMLTLLAAMLCSSLAFGATIQFTTDNEVTYFEVNDSVIIDTANEVTNNDNLTGNLASWSSVKTFNYGENLPPIHSINWKLTNAPLGGDDGVSGGPTDRNPMAFIAQIDFNDDNVWDLLTFNGTPWSLSSNGNSGSYEMLYGTGAWGVQLGSDIFSDAYWLGFEDATEMQVGLTIAPTPLPAAVILFGTGLIGIVGLRGKFA